MLASLLLSATVASAATVHIPADQRPIDCDNCAAWNAPHAPFKLFGHSYFVGVDGLSSVLIDTGEGLILLDGGLPQSAAVIAANIHTLGFDVADVEWIATSHPHYDHVGGVAALARLSGAKVAASASAAKAMRSGTAAKDDPQAGFGDEMDFPRIAEVEVLKHRDVIKFGRITLTMHHTPGHAPGGSSWTWRDCEGERCIDLVFADSLNAVSHDEYKFTADGGAGVARFRESIATLRALPCDLMVSVHPSNSQLFERQAKTALVDSNACRAYADTAERRLDQRLSEEAEAARN